MKTDTPTIDNTVSEHLARADHFFGEAEHEITLAFLDAPSDTAMKHVIGKLLGDVRKLYQEVSLVSTFRC